MIAFFNDENGAEVVASILEEAPAVEIAAVNLLEIAYDAVGTTGDHAAAAEVIEATRQLPVRIGWDLDQPVLEIAARLKATFRISLADSIALALAVSRDAPLVSSDHHEFDPLESAGVARFVWIR